MGSTEAVHVIDRRNERRGRDRPHARHGAQSLDHRISRHDPCDSLFCRLEFRLQTLEHCQQRLDPSAQVCRSPASFTRRTN
jgi:hypothetical protein